MNDRSDSDLALRALRDCGTIRVTLGKVPRGYQQLQKLALITARRFGDTQADLRLSVSGHRRAAALRPME